MTDQAPEGNDTIAEDEPTGGGEPTAARSAATAGEDGSETEYGNDTGFAGDATVDVPAEPS